MAGLTHAAIISKIDARAYRYPELRDNKNTVQAHVDTYIFETLVAKIQALEAKIDQLESSEADRTSFR